MRPLRFALLGTGYWAVRTHGAALSVSDHADLVGVWGRDPAKADDVAEQLGTSAYDDLDELLSSVDAVAIALPPDVQAQMAVRAAGAGCHLLLDKPLALDVPSAQAVVKAADDAGVASVVFFTSRYHRGTEQWTEAAAERAPWHTAHFISYNNIFQPGGHYAGSAWRREYGALWDVGPHALAALVPIMGPVRSVAARPGPAGSDTVHVFVAHGPDSSNGERAGDKATATSTFSVSLSMPAAGMARQLVLYGQDGVWARPEADVDPVEAFLVAIEELAALVTSGERRHRCDARFGLYVVRALAVAATSLQLPGLDLKDK